MQVGLPDRGTGAAEAAPHRRPNWVALLTNVKKAALLAARPPRFRETNPDWQYVPAGAWYARRLADVKQGGMQMPFRTQRRSRPGW